MAKGQKSSFEISRFKQAFPLRFVPVAINIFQKIKLIDISAIEVRAFDKDKK